MAIRALSSGIPKLWTKRDATEEYEEEEEVKLRVVRVRVRVSDEELKRDRESLLLNSAKALILLFFSFFW